MQRLMPRDAWRTNEGDWEAVGKSAGEEMKHRSIIAFILVAAALFAAPQITHDLLSFKSAVGARVRGEIVHAFISLSRGDGSQELIAQSTNTPTIICARENGDTQAAPKSKKSEVRAPVATRTGASTQQGGQEQLTMLVSPSLLDEGMADETSDADTNVFDKNSVGKSFKLPRQTPAQGELTMLVQPDANAVAPLPVGAQSNKTPERSRACASRKDAEAQRQLSRFAVEFAGRKIDSQASGVSILREFAAALPASYEFRVGGGAQRVKFVRVRRCGGKDGSTPISYTQKA